MTFLLRQDEGYSARKKGGVVGERGEAPMSLLAALLAGMECE